ncbi:hypothetical protein OGM63_26995 [Plectonema radiosum NIES-515]|uniref:Uncharacterized protein n=1 Tax=Plectonema radiosum NIES-515 TaxID=2986073 RepID=A0ABT3B6V4_9CYAN|nr:hypothetical protein [Plectonema radiosum]MCV3217113.1 hypothetical protein [Plectonema radiosum NIES-515]
MSTKRLILPNPYRAWFIANESHRQDYSETPINELLAYAKRLYGLKDLDVVRERRKAHKQQRTARWAEAS